MLFSIPQVMPQQLFPHYSDFVQEQQQLVLVKSGNIPIKFSTSRSLAPSISGLSVLPEIVSRKFLASGSGGGAVSMIVSLVCRVPDWKMVGSEWKNLRGRRKCFMNAGRRENSHIRPVM